MKKHNIIFNLLVLGILILGLHINTNAQEANVPDGYTGIYNIADLWAIRNDTEGKYILMNDIDMTAATKKGGAWDSGMGWSPIEEFSGILDGNGHQIIGMNIYTKGNDVKDYIGFIKKLCVDGTIKNLGMKNVSIDVNARYVGAFAGESVWGQIENCYVSGYMKNINNRGRNGGFLGDDGSSTVKNCFSAINIDGTSEFMAGVVGNPSFTSVINCYSCGTIKGGSYKYGISMDRSSSFFKNCFYLKGSVEQSGDIAGVKVLTNEQMKYPQSFTGFDFQNTWEIDPYCNYPYPQLKNNRYIRVKNLTLLSKPYNVTYNQGDKLDLSGATVKVVYDDGKDVNIAISKEMVGSYNMKKLGTQTIFVQYGGKKVSFDIKVKEIFASSIKLSKSKIDINKGKNYQLKATIYPTNTTNQKTSWSSDNSSIATVNGSGKIIAKSAGTTIVWGRTANGKVAKCIVNVKVPTVNINMASARITLKEGKSKKLKVIISPIDSTDKVKWYSENPKIAKVDQTGKVTALKEGETTIYASTDDFYDYWDACTVRVKKSFGNTKKVSISKTVIKNVSALKNKKVLIKYNKVKEITGYQIQYSTKKNFTEIKTKTVKNTSLKISGLKVKKKYYFRVRAYKKVNGKTYYSGWSKVKSVKVKK